MTQREYFRKYRAAHPELKSYHAAYYQAHKAEAKLRQAAPKARAAMKEYRQRNKARRYAQWKAWAARNPERALAIAKKHAVSRRPRKRLSDKQYRLEKPEVYAASIARAKAAKPELYRQIAVKSSLTRRARKKAAAVEPVSVPRIIQRDGNRCHLCGGMVAPPDRSLDHLIPVVRRGAHAEWNMMLAHLSCNKRRGTKQILTEETKAGAESYIARRCAEAAA